MTNFNPTTACEATFAGAILCAMSFAADGATSRATEPAADAEYGIAVTACNRMNGGAALRCMRDVDAASKAATMEEHDDQRGGGSLEPGTSPYAADPMHRRLPAGESLPANLARNKLR